MDIVGQRSSKDQAKHYSHTPCRGALFLSHDVGVGWPGPPPPPTPTRSSLAEPTCGLRPTHLAIHSPRARWVARWAHYQLATLSLPRLFLFNFSAFSIPCKALTRKRYKESITVVSNMFNTLKCSFRDFPGGPVLMTSPPNARGAGSIPGQGAKIPHASWPKVPKQKTGTIL